MAMNCVLFEYEIDIQAIHKYLLWLLFKNHENKFVFTWECWRQMCFLYNNLNFLQNIDIFQLLKSVCVCPRRGIVNGAHFACSQYFTDFYSVQ